MSPSATCCCCWCFAYLVIGAIALAHVVACGACHAPVHQFVHQRTSRDVIEATTSPAALSITAETPRTTKSVESRSTANRGKTARRTNERQKGTSQVSWSFRRDLGRSRRETSLACRRDQRWEEARRFLDRQVSSQRAEKTQGQALSAVQTLPSWFRLSVRMTNHRRNVGPSLHRQGAHVSLTLRGRAPCGDGIKTRPSN
jgi:hypothetical protein